MRACACPDDQCLWRPYCLADTGLYIANMVLSVCISSDVSAAFRPFERRMTKTGFECGSFAQVFRVMQDSDGSYTRQYTEHARVCGIAAVIDHQYRLCNAPSE